MAWGQTGQSGVTPNTSLPHPLCWLICEMGPGRSFWELAGRAQQNPCECCCPPNLLPSSASAPPGSKYPGCMRPLPWDPGARAPCVTQAASADGEPGAGGGQRSLPRREEVGLPGHLGAQVLQEGGHGCGQKISPQWLHLEDCDADPHLLCPQLTMSKRLVAII